MELQALGLIDVTPRTTGILDLWSMSTDGTYEVREHMCGSDSYKLLSRGNYTDIPIMISTNTCIKIANIIDRSIHVSYRWTFGGGVNTLLISTAILYVFFLIVVGITTCIGCGFGGRIIRWIYDSKIAPLLQRDICTVPPECTTGIQPEHKLHEDRLPMDVIHPRYKPLPPLPPNAHPPEPSAPDCIYSHN